MLPQMDMEIFLCPEWFGGKGGRGGGMCRGNGGTVEGSLCMDDMIRSCEVTDTQSLFVAISALIAN